MRRTPIILYTTFILVLGFACYRSPIPGEFDRFMYEGVIRVDRHEAAQQIYDSIRLESPRMEESSHSGLFDSTDHFVKLEPLYRVKPLYLCMVRAVSAKWLPIQTSISVISAAAFCAIGFIFLLWTRSPLLSALLLSSPAATELGRSGSPDGVSAVCLLCSLWAVKANRPYIGLLILVIAVWLRPDNVLLLACVCVWVWSMKRAKVGVVALFAAAGILSVFLVNRLAGAYGWGVLFRSSFIGGRPGEITNASITAREYLAVFVSNAGHLFPQLAIYALLAAVAWRISVRVRDLITTIAAAAALHYILFPSGEQRYLLWACLAAGIALIVSLNPPHPDAKLSLSGLCTSLRFSFAQNRDFE